MNGDLSLEQRYEILSSLCQCWLFLVSNQCTIRFDTRQWQQFGVDWKLESLDDLMDLNMSNMAGLLHVPSDVRGNLFSGEWSALYSQPESQDAISLGVLVLELCLLHPLLEGKTEEEVRQLADNYDHFTGDQQMVLKVLAGLFQADPREVETLVVEMLTLVQVDFLSLSPKKVNKIKSPSGYLPAIA